MQEIKTTLHRENKQVEINLTAFIPVAETKPCTEEDIYTARKRMKARAYDIIGTFSPLIIASLERRMQACQNKLLAHITEAKAYNENVISWIDKRGVRCEFNLGTYRAMETAVARLKKSDWSVLYNNHHIVCQVIKAFMNDEIQDHEDKGGFHYSELVSLLVELSFPHEKRID